MNLPTIIIVAPHSTKKGNRVVYYIRINHLSPILNESGPRIMINF
jgi:hypothetical protein